MRPTRCLATTALARGGGVPQTPTAARGGGHSCPPSVRLLPGRTPSRTFLSETLAHLLWIPRPLPEQIRPPRRQPSTPPSLGCQTPCSQIPLPITFITPVRPITYRNLAFSCPAARFEDYDSFFISSSHVLCPSGMGAMLTYS